MDDPTTVLHGLVRQHQEQQQQEQQQQQQQQQQEQQQQQQQLQQPQHQQQPQHHQKYIHHRHEQEERHLSFEHLRQRQHQDQTMPAMQGHQHDHAHVEPPPRPLLHATHLSDLTSNGGSRQTSNAIHDSNSMILTRNLIASAIESSHSHNRAHGGAENGQGVSGNSGSSSSKRHNETSNAVSPSISALETLDTAMASAVAAAAARDAGLPSASNPSSPSAGAYHSEHNENGRIISASFRGGGSSNNGSSSSSSHGNSTSPNSGPSANKRAVDQEDRFEKNPMIIRWPADDWESWFQNEKVHGRWNLIRHRQRDKDSFSRVSRGPTASEWSREYHCDHAGQYRDRKNPAIEPKKKRKRSESIKCGCPAFIKIRKQFLDEEVTIEYSWKHVGHIPDILEDIKAQRLPQDLKAWIKTRVQDGMDWKTVKSIMTTGSPLIDELHPATRQNLKQLVPVSYAQFANSVRQLSRTGGTRSPSIQPSERATGQSLMAFGSGHGEASLVQTSRSSTPTLSHTTDPSQSHAPPGPVPKATPTVSHEAAWQLIELNHEQRRDTLQHQYTGSSDPIQTRSQGQDQQTLAVHTLVTPEEQSSHKQDASHGQTDVDRQIMSLNAISRAIQEQADSSDGLPSLTSRVGNNVQDSANYSIVTHSNGPGEDAVSAVAAAAGILYSHAPGPASGYLDSTDVEMTLRQPQPSNSPRPVHAQTTQSSQPSQAQLQPREMMLEVLRGIADLHKRMEATEEYGTQEDATQIVESFALPIRLMKEALERNSKGH